MLGYCLCHLDIDTTSELQSNDWTLLMNRGGLYHVSENTFQLFLTMELEIRQCFSTFNPTATKETVLEKILKNDDVFDQWYYISSSWGDESEDLLQMVAEHWITIRGFSHCSAFMEMYKGTIKLFKNPKDYEKPLYLINSDQ